MIDLPLTGWPRDVIDLLVGIIANVVNPQKISLFYIGRSNNITATKSRHRCDNIVALYKTDSADNAIAVEDILIKKFYGHPKCDNDAEHSGGGVSDYYVNYVYLALWYK